VFLNRLALGMALDADPTVQYALADDPGSVERFGFWKQGLTLEDLQVDSPYNTYVNGGLPPGPIAGPGLASLEAVAHPAQSSYLYFVAREDGSHVFAETLEEHLRNVENASAEARMRRVGLIGQGLGTPCQPSCSRRPGPPRLDAHYELWDTQPRVEQQVASLRGMNAWGPT
jgi:hypothetical protein